MKLLLKWMEKKIEPLVRKVQGTCGLQYSSSQLKTQAESSAKLATEIEELNDWNSVSIICWNCHTHKNDLHMQCLQGIWFTFNIAKLFKFSYEATHFSFSFLLSFETESLVNKGTYHLKLNLVRHLVLSMYRCVLMSLDNMFIVTTTKIMQFTWYFFIHMVIIKIIKIKSHS